VERPRRQGAVPALLPPEAFPRARGLHFGGRGHHADAAGLVRSGAPGWQADGRSRLDGDPPGNGGAEEIRLHAARGPRRAVQMRIRKRGAGSASGPSATVGFRDGRTLRPSQ
jgi:hypothetical protein